MRRFVGVRLKDGTGRVYVEDDRNASAPRRRLQHGARLKQHSPAAFDWGSLNAASGELARALVAEVLGDPEPAPRLYLTFKARVVRVMPHPGWALEEWEVQGAIDQIAEEFARRDREAKQAAHEGAT
jgi:hypothetical protein